MDRTNFKDAFDAGQSQSEIRKVDGSIPFVVIPDDSKVHDLEGLMPTPARKRATVKLTEVESFVAYVNRQKCPLETMIYAAVTGCGAVFTAVLDDHGDADGSPGWRGHRAMFSTKPTVEYERWNGSNKKQMSQADFAVFIEENLPNIVSPDGASLLEVARKLEATTTVQFASATRLDNGNTAFRYEETTDAKVGEKGELQVPTMFKIGIQLFEGSPAYEIAARLKYRINGKTLVLWYELVNPHLVVKDAIQEILKTIRSETSVAVLMGEP